MSQERATVEVGKQGQENMPVVETREQKKARFAQVLDRSIVGDRLKVTLPDNLYGEWVPNDQLEIYRMETLGFKIDTEYAHKRELHSKGDAASYVGDTVFMVCEKETHEILEEIRAEQYARLNSKSKFQKEERDYTKSTENLGLPAINEGSVNVAKKAELEAALGVTKD